MNNTIIRNKPLVITLLGVLAVCIALLLLDKYSAVDKDKGVILDIIDAEGTNKTEKTINFIRVDVEGEVKNPGVYEFEEGQIVDDAIKAAGGLTENADTDYVNKNINRAKKLQDAEKIYIPGMGEVTGQENSGTGGVESKTSGKVNINTASSEELDLLPGIGPSYAEKIIQGRPYSKIEDIKKVPGIGDSTFEKIKDQISV